MKQQELNLGEKGFSENLIEKINQEYTDIKLCIDRMEYLKLSHKVLEAMCEHFSIKDILSLTPKELKYFKYIFPQSGVLMIKSKPGIAKSAILNTIAKKLKMQYFDIRLSQIDETEVGMFPKVVDIDVDGKKDFALKHIVPEWCHMANSTCTLVNFEELNRASLSVRNAALQLFLEREIGYSFKFTNNVFMVATGNLGEEDGTIVEEFDKALNGRLIQLKHDLTIDEWCEGYAIEYVQPFIVDFIKSKPEYYYDDRVNENSSYESYPSPRSWTFLSDYITKWYGDNCIVNKDVIDDLASVCDSYIGKASIAFVQYLSEGLLLNINDVLNDYKKARVLLKKYNRSKKSELLLSLKSLKLSSLERNQIDNVILFMDDLAADEACSYVFHVTSNEYEYDPEKYTISIKEQENITYFLKNEKMRKYLLKLQNKKDTMKAEPVENVDTNSDNNDSENSDNLK